MSRTHQNGGQASQRMLRVAELIRHAMAELLSRGAFNDPVLESHPVTVPLVKMSPDLKLATVFVMPLGGRDIATVLAALDSHKKELRTAIAHRINLRFAPDMRFKADDSFAAQQRIDELLHRPEVLRDLKPHDEEDGEAGTAREQNDGHETH